MKKYEKKLYIQNWKRRFMQTRQIQKTQMKIENSNKNSEIGTESDEKDFLQVYINYFIYHDQLWNMQLQGLRWESKHFKITPNHVTWKFMSSLMW